MKSKKEIEEAFETLISTNKEVLDHKPYTLLDYLDCERLQQISAMSRIEVYIWILDLPRPDFRCYES